MNPRIIGTVARRGMIFAYPVVHSAIFLRGGSQSRTAWVFGIVTSVSRDGEIRRYERFHAGSRQVHKGRPVECLLITRVLNVDSMRAALTWDTEFESSQDARDFARRFLAEKPETAIRAA